MYLNGFTGNMMFVLDKKKNVQSRFGKQRRGQVQILWRGLFEWLQMNELSTKPKIIKDLMG